MFQLKIALWMPFLAFVLGSIAQQLQADGGASLLSKFTTWRLKPIIVYPLSLAFATCAGVFQNMQNGEDVQTAIAHALFAGAMMVFGGATAGKTVGLLMKKGPPAGPGIGAGVMAIFGVIAMLAFAAFLTACAALSSPTAKTVEGDSCAAIKIADEACGLILVKNPDGGKPVEVPFTGHELQEIAARRVGMSLDGGPR